MKLKVLLDSTYLLPVFGIAVDGLTKDDITNLKRLSESKVVYYCASIVWVEILGKVHKEASKRGLEIEDLVSIAVDSLVNAGFYRWVEPDSYAVKLAFSLRQKGHKDMIDNLLYGIARSREMVLLTMDRAFKEFLRKNNFDTGNVFDHKKLFRELL